MITPRPPPPTRRRSEVPDDDRPIQRRHQPAAITAGTNQPRPGPHALDRGSGSLRVRDHLACAQEGVGPTFSARITNEPVLLSDPAMTFAQLPWSRGMDSPVTSDSRSTPALGQFPSTGTFSPADAQPSAT